MMLDSTLQLANAYAPTSVATNVSGTYLDTSVIEDWGMGNSLIWLVMVNTTATSGGSATVQFLLQGATDSAFTSPATVAIAPVPGGTVAVAALTKGLAYFVKFPRGQTYRYYRVAVVIGTAALTAGKFDSWILNDAAQDLVSYAAGYTVY